MHWNCGIGSKSSQYVVMVPVEGMPYVAKSARLFSQMIHYLLNVPRYRRVTYPLPRQQSALFTCFEASNRFLDLFLSLARLPHMPAPSHAPCCLTSHSAQNSTPTENYTGRIFPPLIFLPYQRQLQRTRHGSARVPAFSSLEQLSLGKSHSLYTRVIALFFFPIKKNETGDHCTGE